MKDQEKTKEQLINELGELRQRIINLESTESDHKKLEEKIQKQKKFLEATFNSLTHPFYVIDVNDYSIKLSNQATRIYDVTKSTKCYTLTHKRNKPCTGEHLCPLDEVKKTKKPVKTEHIHYDKYGNTRYVDIHGYPIFDDKGNITLMIEYTLDITKRKKAEEALAQERQRLSYILRGTNVGTWEWNVQTGETTYNERWAEIIGYTLEEISPVSIDTWMKFTHPDDIKVSDELLEKHFNGELYYFECQSRMRHKNGDWIWVLDRGKVTTWTEDGNPLLMFGTHQDITERKRAEEALRDSEERYRSFFHHFQGIAFRARLDFTPVFFHGAVEKITGYTIEEFIAGKPRWDQIVHPDDVAYFQERVMKALSSKKESAEDEHRIICKNGKVRWIHQLTHVVFDNSGKPLYADGTLYESPNVRKLRRHCGKVRKDWI